MMSAIGAWCVRHLARKHACQAIALIALLAVPLLQTRSLSQEADTQSRYARGVQFFQEGRLDRAEQEFSSLVKLTPRSPEPYLFLGRIYLAKNIPEKAQAMLQEAVRLKPDFVEAYQALGIVYLQEKSYEKAEGAFTEAVRLKPDYALAHLNLGSVYLQQDKADKAVGEFDKAIACAPGDRAIALAARSNLGSYYLRLGLLLTDSERYSEAVQNLEEAQKRIPDSFELFQSLGTDYYNLGRYQEAQRALLRAAELRQDFPQTYLTLGKTYVALGDSRAGESFTKCTELDPKRDEAWEALGQELTREKAFDQAVKIFARYVELFPNKPLAHLLLGQAYFDNKTNLPKALEEFKAAAKLDPQSSRAYYSAGFVCKTLRNWKEAETFLTQAIALDNQNVLANYQLGDLLLIEENYQQSVAYLERALALKPDLAEAYLRLGQVSLRQKNEKQAAAYLQKAIALHPDYTQAHWLLAKAYQGLNEPELAKKEFDRFRELQEEGGRKMPLDF